MDSSVRGRSRFKSQPMRALAGGLACWCLRLNWVSNWNIQCIERNNGMLLYSVKISSSFCSGILPKSNAKQCISQFSGVCHLLSAIHIWPSVLLHYQCVLLILTNTERMCKRLHIVSPIFMKAGFKLPVDNQLRFFYSRKQQNLLTPSLPVGG